jgi:hypothetical protein
MGGGEGRAREREQGEAAGGEESDFFHDGKEW